MDIKINNAVMQAKVDSIIDKCGLKNAIGNDAKVEPTEVPTMPIDTFKALSAGKGVITRETLISFITNEVTKELSNNFQKAFTPEERIKVVDATVGKISLLDKLPKGLAPEERIKAGDKTIGNITLSALKDKWKNFDKTTDMIFYAVGGLDSDKNGRLDVPREMFSDHTNEYGNDHTINNNSKTLTIGDIYEIAGEDLEITPTEAVNFMIDKAIGKIDIAYTNSNFIIR